MRSDVPSTGIWNERRFRDARLARAPVSLVESVVLPRTTTTRPVSRRPKDEVFLFFVTVCDANAHGLREGDGVAFIDPLAEDTDDVARGRGAETRETRARTTRWSSRNRLTLSGSPRRTESAAPRLRARGVLRDGRAVDDKFADGFDDEFDDGFDNEFADLI